MVSITLDCEIRYTIIGGIIRITVAAIALPERAIPPLIIVLITFGSILSSSVKIVPDGCIDHKSRKAKRQRVSHAGFAIGITMRQNICKSFAPSIYDASISALGTLPSIYCFIRNTPMVDGR